MKPKVTAVLVAFLMLSLLYTTTSPYFVSGLAQPASSGDEQEDWTIPPNVEKYMNTEWQSPLTDEDRSVLLTESSLNVWSETQTETRIVSVDLNKTVEGGGERGDQSQPVWSVWPWQDDSHDRKDFSALPVAPNMNGHYWLKKSYSTLAFDIEIDEPITESVYIWIWLVRVQDTYSRFLTIEFDNNQVDRFVVGHAGFKGGIFVPSSMIETGVDRHLVELTINYGGWKDRGWRLEYSWVGIGNGPNGYQQTPPLTEDSPYYPEEFTELVPRSGLTDTSVEYKVICGPSTKMNIITENVDDSYSRVVDVYVDDVYKTSVISPGAYEVSLGDYAPGSQPCLLKLVFKNMPDIDCAKRITQLSVHRIGFYLSIDVMEGVYQSTILSQLNAMNAWLQIYGYHRVSIYFSGELPADPAVTLADHNYYYWVYNEHKLLSFWEYVIVVEKLSPAYAGWHAIWLGIFDIGIAISDTDSGATTIWHEYGHHIGTTELDNVDEEEYCTNLKCVMSRRTNAYYYCWFHWHLRYWY